MRTRARALMRRPRAARFSNVHALVLYFPGSFGGHQLRLYYVGFQGTYAPVRDARARVYVRALTRAQLTRDPVVTVYELQPNVADHEKVKEARAPNSNVF